MLRNRVGGTMLAFSLLMSGSAYAAGAIAVDDEAGTKAGDVGYGIGSGDSREEAATQALSECRKAGNSKCEVVVRYDTCGAYAVSANYSGSGWGSNEDAAKAKALEACGNASCRVVVSDCDN